MGGTTITTACGLGAIAVLCRADASLALQQHAAELSQPARLRLARAAGALHALSPLAVLERCYAVVTANGQVIRAAAQVEVGAELAIRLHAGTLRTRVLATE